jgi:hypothetical protein
MAGEDAAYISRQYPHPLPSVSMDAIGSDRFELAILSMKDERLGVDL